MRHGLLKPCFRCECIPQRSAGRSACVAPRCENPQKVLTALKLKGGMAAGSIACFLATVTSAGHPTTARHTVVSVYPNSPRPTASERPPLLKGGWRKWRLVNLSDTGSASKFPNSSICEPLFVAPCACSRLQTKMGDCNRNLEHQAANEGPTLSNQPLLPSGSPST
jgi:hypothetical protein